MRVAKRNRRCDVQARILGLEERAAVEGLFWRLCRRLVELNKKRKRVPVPRAARRSPRPNQYMATSALPERPDHWAINQLFPIVPLHGTRAAHPRLHHRGHHLRLGWKIDSFIEGETVDETIALHPLRRASRTTWACS